MTYVDQSELWFLFVTCVWAALAALLYTVVVYCLVCFTNHTIYSNFSLSKISSHYHHETREGEETSLSVHTSHISTCANAPKKA